MTRKTAAMSTRNGPATPSFDETCAHMAQAGDVEGLWRILADADWTMLDLPTTFKHLQRAVEVASRADPAAFADALFTRILAFGHYLLLRGQFYVTAVTARHDAAARGRGPTGLADEVTDALLPPLLDLQRQLAETAEAQARTARTWGLARKKKAPPSAPSSRTAGGPPPNARDACAADEPGEAWLDLLKTEDPSFWDDLGVDDGAAVTPRKSGSPGGPVAGTPAEDRPPGAAPGETGGDRLPARVR